MIILGTNSGPISYLGTCYLKLGFHFSRSPVEHCSLAMLSEGAQPGN
jgi:hypothetical protein